MPNPGSGPTNSSSASPTSTSNGPSAGTANDGAYGQERPQPRESAMREVTHVKVATRCAKEKNVRTTIDLKRPWYYSA